MKKTSRKDFLKVLGLGALAPVAAKIPKSLEKKGLCPSCGSNHTKLEMKKNES